VRLGRFERRIIAAIALVAAVTLGGALWFGQTAVTEAYEVGVNDRVLHQLEGSLDVYRDYFRAVRDHADRTADSVAFDRRGDAALSADGAALARFLDDTLDRYDNVARVVVESASGEVLASAERPDRLDTERSRLLTLQRPAADGARFLITVTTPIAPFREFERADELTTVYARLHGGASYVTGFYLAVYIAFLLSVIVVALAVGIVISRRVTRRVAVLAEATERVGRGDLGVQVPLDGQDEVAELTRAFNAMVRDIRESRDRIEYLQRIGAWQEFARRLAHEIKNPLTPIQLSAERIKRKFSRHLEEEQEASLAELTAVIVRQTNDLRRIVDEFSKFARMPEPERRDEDLGELVRGAVLLQQSGQPDVRISADVTRAALPARLDAGMIGQALTNLIKNAGEATETLREKGAPEGYVPAVHVSCTHDGPAENGEPWATVRIEDNGIGLPEDRARLFEPYVTTRDKGTGLGLPIVKKIIEEHGGTLTLEDAPPFEGCSHHGAAAVIRLPLTRGEPEAAEPAPARKEREREAHE